MTQAMNYVDGFVAPVLTANREAYLQHAKDVAVLFKEFGETVVFSWVTWPSRAVRDAGWAKLMADPRMTSGAIPPFDGKRMIYGGFEVLLNV